MRERQRLKNKPIPHGTEFGYTYWLCRCVGCTEAHRVNQKKWRSTSYRSRRSTHLKADYGINIDDYERIFKKQRGKCKICKRPCPSNRVLAVDHCHATKVIRGLLCMRCNMGLGHYETWFLTQRKTIERYLAGAKKKA